MDQPTLVVNGVHDEMIAVRNFYWLSENLPNAVLFLRLRPTKSSKDRDGGTPMAEHAFGTAGGDRGPPVDGFYTMILCLII